MASIDFKKLQSTPHVTVWGGPSGNATGIDNVAVPTVAEISNTGNTSKMLNWSPSISWNDTSFGPQESETLNDPSFADESTYEDFGAKNYGGEISTYYPKDYDDNSNNHSLVYDQSDTPRTALDFVMRVDGAKKTTQPIANGDFVHVFRVLTDAETNALVQPDAYRRTVGLLSQGEAAFHTIVGPHTLTAVPAPTTPWKAGSVGRLRVTVQGRDYTNALSFVSSNSSVVEIQPGGFYKVNGASATTATITITDDEAGTTATQTVTVTA